jgi:hypothetical protein
MAGQPEEGPDLVTQPNQNNPGQGGQQHRGEPRDQKQHEQGRGTDESQKQGSKGYGGGSTEEKHPGGKAVDINGPAGSGKGGQGSRRQDR